MQYRTHKPGGSGVRSKAGRLGILQTPTDADRLVRVSRRLAATVIVLAALDWTGWATGQQMLTRIAPGWPQMTPWTAALLAAGSASLIAQSGEPPPARVWLGRALAVMVAVFSLFFLVEYATGSSSGVDLLWFPGSVRELQTSWPGRPSPQTALSLLMLALAALTQRINHPRAATAVWAGLLAFAATIPALAVLAYASEALPIVSVAPSTGIAVQTAVGLLLLTSAAAIARPDRNPVAWALTRPDGQVLVRTAGVLAGLPLLVSFARQIFLAAGLPDNVAWTLAVAVATLITGAATYYLARRAQRLLATSEARYRLITENVGEVIVSVRDARIEWISPSVEDALGAPPQHWVGQPVSTLFSGENPGQTPMEQWNLSDGTMVKQRVRVLSGDETTHWAELVARRPPNSSDRESGVNAVFRIIDNEVAIEQEAEEARRDQALAEQRYRKSVENASIGMCLVSPEGRFLEVNDALCQLFGYDAQTLEAKTWQDLTAPEYLDADVQNVTDLLQGRAEAYRMTKQYIHADGHRIWGDLSVGCVRDEKGAVVNFVSQITDITAVKDAEERNRLLVRELLKQRDQTSADLRSAAAYMSSIMPRGLSGRVEVTSRFLPAQELGGDCLDYLWIDDDHLLVYLIDVSGHGIEPALLAVSVHNLLRSGSIGQATLLDPRATLIELNRLFQMDQQGEHFFTAWYGVYEASSRILRYASAGAPPAFAFATGGQASAVELSTPWPPVGTLTEIEFSSAEYTVPAGCELLVFSDGAFEIDLSSGRQLTLEEFKDLCTRLAGSGCWSLDDLVGELAALNKSSEFTDDCSLIRVKFA